ncbi:uncharacterized protein LOC119676913 [Teleopsis dalmanni]|uniref:uncharacterized protein LOC119676913 n=1 Tax=Teleopsis dalmanni TaxID=139649 RepID=UPI0018CF6100|nr:uncharacterized protein LOC119676913 [Teleopsis dalmanni]
MLSATIPVQNTLLLVIFSLTLPNYLLTTSMPISPDTSSTNLGTYPPEPNEILPIQPVLLYPKPRQLQLQARKMEKDNDIIYVQLLKRKSHKPKKRLNEDEIFRTGAAKELSMKDIFYVKALANGQFSHQRS